MPVADIRGQSGARLAYVVVKLNGTVKRDQTRFEPGKGLQTVPTEEDAGFLVYFPRGHVLRLTKDQLKEYNLRENEAPIINMAGLSDPNSTIGRMMASQDAETRRGAWRTMEEQVIKLATAKTGPILTPEMVNKNARLSQTALEA